MEAQEYINTRIDEQIRFYGARSRSNKRSFMMLSVMQIVLASMLPLITTSKLQNLLGDAHDLLVSTIGVLIVISTGLLNLNKYQEKWTIYRKTAEKLKQQKYIFLTQAPVPGQDSFEEFVNRIEEMLAGENKEWADKMDAKLPVVRKP